ncbi:MAG: SMP-30/gluconolactonase/LRE family protein [Verrucomicrobia bacterium]|nr:SMP-30/gluconolactonase/LRE family protein [Verrucomicrobiota bacterium]
MIRLLGLKQDFELHDERFTQLTLPNAWVERLHTGMLWTEGPAYFADGDYLVWSDIPNNLMYRWVQGHVSVFRHPSNYANGNTRDRTGRLITCEHGARRVSVTEPDGTVRTLVDRFEGKRLNSPNDAVVKADGTVWFSDPPYGIMSDYEGYAGPSEYGHAYVFRFDPATQTLTVVADDFNRPNGLAFSPDETRLYIADSGGSHKVNGEHHVRVFDVTTDGRLQNGRVFAEVSPGVPDGLRLDTSGNVWVSAADGVHCYDPDGQLLGKIKVPEPVANLTFGGPRRNRLFITATTSVYSAFVGVRGAQTP